MKLKVSISWMIFYMLLSISPTVSADKAEVPELVLDMANEAILPRRFRTTAQALPAGVNVSGLGLKDLAIAGTAQFSEKALQEITKHFPSPFLVIDLRQESHGFINGNAISWKNRWDNANQGKTAAQILKKELLMLQGLASLPIIHVMADIKNAKRHITNLPNKYIQSEQQLVENMGLGYKRFFITDHFAPTVKDVDGFIRFRNTLPQATKILFHCRGGAGRTTTYMVMTDMMRNAKQVSFNDILKRQMLLGGNDLFNLPVSNDYKYLPAKQRLKFLRKFYQYCSTNNDNYKTSWSQWIKKYKKVK